MYPRHIDYDEIVIGNLRKNKHAKWPVRPTAFCARKRTQLSVTVEENEVQGLFSMTQLLTINRTGSETIQWVTAALMQAGLQVSQSFDLRSVRDAFTACTCEHKADTCDCDMAILLVYGAVSRPATIMVHSRNGRTWLSLVDTFGQRAPAALEKTILQTVSTTSF